MVVVKVKAVTEPKWVRVFMGLGRALVAGAMELAPALQETAMEAAPQLQQLLPQL